MAEKKIFSIEAKKKEYIITFYDDSQIVILFEDYLKYDLADDKEIEETIIEEIRNNYLQKKGYDTALKLLSIKRLSETEIKNKLYLREYPENVIDEIINKLKEYNFINDESLIESVIRLMMEQEHAGFLKIKKKLIERGLSSKIIEVKLNELYTEEYEEEAIQELISKKIKTYSDKLPEIKKKEKLLLYLQNKGFLRNRIVKYLFE
ncbi:MAG: RecX family transcriptional regulator [bacterium]|nr:RecX family transcriptional regulator [bacterium]